jgi:hypothetical protein
MTTFVERWGSPSPRDDPRPPSARRRGRGRDDSEPLDSQDHVGSSSASRDRPRSESSPYARATPVDGSSSHDWGIDRRYHNSSSYYKSSARWNTDHRGGSGGSPLDQRARLATNATTQRDIEPLVLLMYSVNLPEVPHVSQMPSTTILILPRSDSADPTPGPLQIPARLALDMDPAAIQHGVPTGFCS